MTDPTAPGEVPDLMAHLAPDDPCDECESSGENCRAHPHPTAEPSQREVLKETAASLNTAGENGENSGRLEYRVAVWQAIAGSLGNATGHYGDVCDTVRDAVIAVRDTEMEQLREYAGTARHHQQQHAEAWREVVRLRAELAGLRERAVILPEDWRSVARSLPSQYPPSHWVSDAERRVYKEAVGDMTSLVESWRAAPEPATPPPSPVVLDEPTYGAPGSDKRKRLVAEAFKDKPKDGDWR